MTRARANLLLMLSFPVYVLINCAGLRSTGTSLDSMVFNVCPSILFWGACVPWLVGLGLVCWQLATKCFSWFLVVAYLLGLTLIVVLDVWCWFFLSP